MAGAFAERYGMKENLESIVRPMLAEFKADGHRMGSFVPALPDALDPNSTSPFASKAVCEMCGEWLVVSWDNPHFRVKGNLLTSDGCKPSLRQPAA